MAANDLMALGVIAEIRSRGLEVPGDVSVVGHDDSAILDYVDPPLTTVRQPIGRLAKHCAQAVNSLLTQGTAKSGEILFSPELRIRKSTAPVRTPRL
jgi:DNA-binding LacI/PurR family transcriptional regulator